MPQQYRCKYCHAPVPLNSQHVCEATGGVHDEDDFLEPMRESAPPQNKKDARDDDDDFPSTEEDHDREFD